MTPKFNLQNVLDLRHTKVEALETDLGKLMAARQNLEDLLMGLYETRTGLLEKLFLEQQGEMDLFNLSVLRANIVATDERINQTIQAIKVMDEKVDCKRQELIAAKQEEEMLVVLKKKQIEAFHQDQKEREAKQQDDIYIASAFRQRREEARNG